MRLLVVAGLGLAIALPAGAQEQPCVSGRAIEAPQRLAIEATALRVLRLMARRQEDQIWGLAHPDFRNTYSREALARYLVAQQPELSQLSAARFADVWLIPGRPGAPAPAALECGARLPGQMDRPRVQLMLDEDAVAMAFVRMPGPVVGRTAVVRLRKVYAEWRLDRVDFSLDQWQGYGSELYAARAEELLASGEILRAMVNLEAAAFLELPAPYILTPFGRGVLERRGEVAGSASYNALVGVWSAGGHAVKIHAVTVIPHEDGLALAVLYVSPAGLVKATNRAEARALRSYLNQRHPELGFQFETAVFVAYAEAPVDYNRKYASNRNALPLID